MKLGKPALNVKSRDAKEGFSGKSGKTHDFEAFLSFEMAARLLLKSYSENQERHLMRKKEHMLRNPEGLPVRDWAALPTCQASLERSFSSNGNSFQRIAGFYRRHDKLVQGQNLGMAYGRVLMFQQRNIVAAVTFG